jgi:cytidyltransferase-related domain
VGKNKKIIFFSKISSAIPLFKNKKTVLVGGCFDIFHYGHFKFLSQAKKQGDFLIVALESDEFIKKNKRKEPVHNQEERAEILSSLNMVDLVIKLPLFSSYNDYFQMVKLIKPKVIAVTEGDIQLENKKKQAKEVGAEVKIVTPLVKKYSTRRILGSIIKEKI